MAGTFITRRKVGINPQEPGDLGRGSDIRIEVRPIGNWSKISKVLNGLGPKVTRASNKAQLKVGREIVKRVKAHLRNQDLGWEELSPEYLEAKKRRGLKTGTLMAWGTYYNSITTWQNKQSNSIFIGVKRGIFTKNLNGRKSPIEVATIAALHEFSTGKRFPRRPLWNPTIKEMGGAEGIKNIWLNSFKYWLRIEGVPLEDRKSIISRF